METSDPVREPDWVVGSQILTGGLDMILFSIALGKQQQMFKIIQPLAQTGKLGALVSLFRYSFTRNNFQQIHVFNAFFSLAVAFLPEIFFSILSVYRD